jgi:hypothetical protein
MQMIFCTAVFWLNLLVQGPVLAPAQDRGRNDQIRDDQRRDDQDALRREDERRERDRARQGSRDVDVIPGGPDSPGAPPRPRPMPPQHGNGDRPQNGLGNGDRPPVMEMGNYPCCPSVSACETVCLKALKYKRCSICRCRHYVVCPERCCNHQCVPVLLRRRTCDDRCQ